MHESGLCMIIGVVITLLAMLNNPDTNFTKTLNFNDENKSNLGFLNMLNCFSSYSLKII